MLEETAERDAALGRRERADARENRARILAATRKLMRRRPLEALCMDEVAACAEVGKGTLYRRFADKAALLRALLDDSEHALQEEVRRGYAHRQREARDALVWLLDLLFSFVVEHAQVLSAVEASARGCARADAPPHVWRRTVITDHLERAGVAQGGAALFMAEQLLASMSADVVTRALTTQTPERVREQGRAFFAAVVAPQQTTFKSTESPGSMKPEAVHQQVASKGTA